VPKPNVVLDTNVLVSSLWRGGCWDVVRQWRDGRFTLAVSPAVLQEYLQVLGRFVNASLLDEWTEALTDPSRTVLVKPVKSLDAVKDDPTDNRFLECAVEAHADVIVSGDRHLLSLRSFRKIPIVTPASFLKRSAW